ncbi:MAG: hypothetical protein U0936_05000 [Planctomycetaceae bacterium]
MSTVVSSRDELKQQIQQLLAEDCWPSTPLLERQFRNPNMFVQDVAQHVGRFQGSDSSDSDPAELQSFFRCLRRLARMPTDWPRSLR